MAAEAEYSPLYLQGIALFNERDFFECHEVLEDVWRSCEPNSRLFYQGLIQAAVGLLHFANGNTVGARKLYWASREKLQPYEPRYLGLDVTGFLQRLADCFAELADNPDPVPDVSLDQSRLPVIELDPPAAPTTKSAP
jgi:predicted metal-dependent hydrolase